MSNRPTVLLDARDAFQTPLRGWGRYALELSELLPAGMVSVYRRRTLGPQVLAEQFALPLAVRSAGVRVVHAPNCFLPLVRGRTAGVVTIHDLAFEAYPDDFSARTGTKYRWITPRAARGAERVITPSQATADDVVARYGVDASKIRVIPNAASLPVGDAPVAPGDVRRTCWRWGTCGRRRTCRAWLRRGARCGGTGPSRTTSSWPAMGTSPRSACPPECRSRTGCA